MKRASQLLSSLLAIGAVLSAPARVGAQSVPPASGRHHHYKLVVIPSLGGLETNFYHDPNNVAVLNPHGAVSGGSADTLIPDPFPQFPWGDLGTVTRAYLWDDGKLTDLGAVDSGVSSYSAWISSNGIIAGASEKRTLDPLVPGSLPQQTAVVWRNGKITDLGFLPAGGYESRAVSVNSRGQVAGSATNLIPDANSFAVDSLFLLAAYPFQSRAFIWDSTEGMTELGALGTGQDSAAYAINEQGQVIGYSYKDTTTPGGCQTPELHTAVLDTGAFIWDRQHGVRDLGNFGGTCTFASAINNRGQVVGRSDTRGDLYPRPFIWENGVMRDLGGSLGGLGGSATRINEHGEAVGSANLPGEATFHATLWRAIGQITDLGTLDGDVCAFGWGINNRTQVVGISSPTDCVNFDVSRPFLWEDGSMIDLNKLIPANSPLFLQYVYSINDQGEIAGNGVDANGASHGYLLIPCDADHRGLGDCVYDE
jgi:probable HAF family extracellular repeat protein